MTIANIVFRRILRSKRTWFLLLLPAIGVLSGALTLRAAANWREAYGGYVSVLLIPIVIALVAIVIGASAVGDEREELTILYLAQTPTPRWRIALETWAASTGATLAIVAVPIAVAYLIGDKAGISATAGVDLLVACVLAAAAYCALAILLGYITRRAVLVGIAYLMLWEGIMSSFASGARNLSIMAHARALVARSVDPLTRYELSPPTTGAGTAFIALTIIVLGSLALAGYRFRRMNLP